MSIFGIFNSDHSGRAGGPDLSIADTFKQKVFQIQKSSTNSKLSHVLPQVETEYRVVTALPFRLWNGQLIELGRKKKELIAEADEIQNKLKDGSIPAFVPGEESFRFPACTWRRSTAFFLGFMGFGIAGLEWVNFAAYQAPNYNSMAISLSYCLPILLFPLAEAVILHRGLFSERLLKWFCLFQGLIAVAAGCAYLNFCFHQADGSMAFLSQQTASAGLSPDALRMAMQIITSICLASTCVQGSLAMGVRRQTKNPECAAAKKTIKKLRRETDKLEARMEEICGVMEEFQAVKDQALASCEQKWSRLEAEREKFINNTNRIINQPL